MPIYSSQYGRNFFRTNYTTLCNDRYKCQGTSCSCKYTSMPGGDATVSATLKTPSEFVKALPMLVEVKGEGKTGWEYIGTW